MKQLAVLSIVLGIVTTTLTYLGAEGPDQEEKLILSIRLLDETQNDGKVRVLAHPKVATPIGRPFSLWQGEKYKSRTGGADFTSGAGASGKLTRRNDGRVHLAMTFSRRTHMPRNIDADVIRIDALEIQCFLQPGIVKRIDCGGSQTCELELEKSD